jgi:heme/copper-type cytochrome/quinol oxidase subunit 2
MGMNNTAAYLVGPAHLKSWHVGAGLIFAAVIAYCVWRMTIPMLEPQLPVTNPDGTAPPTEWIDLVVINMFLFGFWIWFGLFVFGWFVFVFWHRHKTNAAQWRHETYVRHLRERETEEKIAAAKKSGLI